MGFDVATFFHLLEGKGRFADLWDTTSIPRDDVSSTGAPRIGARSLDAAGGLGLVLHYLGSAVLEVGLQQIFAIVPSVLSRYLDFGMDILLRVLRQIPEGRIRLPQTPGEFASNSNIITSRHSMLEGAFGSIDGLSLAVQTSDDPETENATYNGWKLDHRINNVLVFSPEGTIIDAVLNAPGSWHDSNVARPIFERLHTRVPNGYFLVADTAFPRGSSSIAGKIRAPLKSGGRLTDTQAERDMALRFNRQLLSYRQTAEWGMRTIQGSFGRLCVPLDVNSPRKRKRLLENCSRLFNVRARCVGINQIKSVYVPIWRATEDEALWEELGNTLFGEIRKRDRVARFHLVTV
ncbi:hypothetical protein V5O48_011398 [Marasmius crinis-equi]|uniref:DDE Tnp4 domain-containing protein n=1 Tax=Marasmius crinis-equi TaxID=585013 RepID=A0ABR3F612_9AGAR